MSATQLPVRKTNCKTCPFRRKSEGGWEEVQPLLAERAILEGTPICHSTGRALVRHDGEKLKAHICRGARDLQLKVFHRLGVITAPTDEAWAAACERLGL